MPNARRVNTRRAEHRALWFDSIEDLEDELEWIERASADGALRAAGNWSPGQILEHLGRFWAMSLDGFGFRASWPARLLARRFKTLALRAPPPRGLQIRRQTRAILPDDDAAFEDGLALLREQIRRVREGERMTHPNPLFGRLSHDEWLRLHLNHCAMHLGFLHAP